MCISFTKLNIYLLLERVFLNFSGYSLTVTQIQANATKRLHQFRNRSHFSRGAKRIYEKTYYSHASSVVSTVTMSAYLLTGRSVVRTRSLSAFRLPLSRLGQPGSIPALVLYPGGIAAKHRKRVTAGRLLFIIFIDLESLQTIEQGSKTLIHASCLQNRISIFSFNASSRTFLDIH
ncbi:hypothetical protein CSKR_107912 [Clonorchis sinensis]|uniref:Uncharacterized protein n=1 Tax=Clonorchis sinensis TaxID=79923 RepID=A0A3R7D8Z2_CLOSI|nr:hypothetical protein CSKR_107912 [Clonorchis sinensis]